MTSFYEEQEALAIARRIVQKHTEDVVQCAKLNRLNGTMRDALVGCETALTKTLVDALTGRRVTIRQRDLIEIKEAGESQ